MNSYVPLFSLLVLSVPACSSRCTRGVLSVCQSRFYSYCHTHCNPYPFLRVGYNASMSKRLCLSADLHEPLSSVSLVNRITFLRVLNVFLQFFIYRWIASFNEYREFWNIRINNSFLYIIKPVLC